MEEMFEIDVNKINIDNVVAVIKAMQPWVTKWNAELEDIPDLLIIPDGD